MKKLINIDGQQCAFATGERGIRSQFYAGGVYRRQQAHLPGMADVERTSESAADAQPPDIRPIHTGQFKQLHHRCRRRRLGALKDIDIAAADTGAGFGRIEKEAVCAGPHGKATGRLQRAVSQQQSNAVYQAGTAKTVRCAAADYRANETSILPHYPTDRA